LLLLNQRLKLELFALIKPATKTRIELQSIDQVDAELTAWLKQAYTMAE